MESSAACSATTDLRSDWCVCVCGCACVMCECVCAVQQADVWNIKRMHILLKVAGIMEKQLKQLSIVIILDLLSRKSRVLSQISFACWAARESESVCTQRVTEREGERERHATLAREHAER